MSPPSAASAVIGPGPTVSSPPPVSDTLPPTPPCLPPLTSIAALTVTAPVPRTSHATQPEPRPAPPAAERGACTTTWPPRSTHASPGAHSAAVAHGVTPSRHRRVP